MSAFPGSSIRVVVALCAGLAGCLPELGAGSGAGGSGSGGGSGGDSGSGGLGGSGGLAGSSSTGGNGGAVTLPPPPTCDPACDPAEVCVHMNDSAVCRKTCGDDLDCTDGKSCRESPCQPGVRVCVSSGIPEAEPASGPNPKTWCVSPTTSRCADLDVDDENCGKCNWYCAGQVCEQGTCPLGERGQCRTTADCFPIGPTTPCCAQGYTVKPGGESHYFDYNQCYWQYSSECIGSVCTSETCIPAD